VTNEYINITTDTVDENIKLIGDTQWWIINGLQIWETTVQKLDCKIKVIFILEIQSRYKLRFLSRLVPLQDTFLNIPDEIKLKSNSLVPQDIWS
jgi:hypothetical protein